MCPVDSLGWKEASSCEHHSVSDASLLCPHLSLAGFCQGLFVYMSTSQMVQGGRDQPSQPTESLEAPGTCQWGPFPERPSPV